MASISVTVSGDAVGSVTITEEFDPQNSQRFLNWLISTYGVDPSGSPRKPNEAVEACWSGIRNGIFDNIKRAEQEAASAAAIAAVSSVESSTTVS